MSYSPALASRAHDLQNGSVRRPLYTEDKDNRLEREDHVLRNVGSEGTEESVRTARPNAGINGQELRGDRGGRADVMGAGAATLEPKVPRPLPPTPATRLEGGFEWVKTEKVERVKVEEKKTRMSTREYFATDDRHQTAGVRPQGHQVSQELDDSQQTTTADTHDEDLSNGEPQLFLLSADSISGADAVSLAKTLNANIFQAAAFIADSLECTPAENNARKQLYLGECITKRLASADPAIVQIALQAAIARWCKRKIDSWCLGDERFGENLCRLYEKVSHTENPTTAHRWRAITRAQTKRNDEDILLASYLVEVIFDVMAAAGWNTLDHNSNGGGFIRDEFAGQIAAIVKYLLQLRKAIGEDIVSEDLEVLYVEPNRIFEDQTMEDTYAVGRVNRSRKTGFDFDIVACTTDIGLQRKSRERVDEKRRDILLRPKVVLESAFNET